MAERLNKLLARAGVASRRGADALIAQKRVTVDGKVATLGAMVTPGVEEIQVDGERVRVADVPDRHFAFYKPRHVISTVSDPYDRPTVVDFIDSRVRLFPVGRLDGASEGLMLLTNDGDLANQLTHPRYEHEREYRVKISGTPLESVLQKWRDGFWLGEERTLPAAISVESSSGGSTWLRWVMREGKNRQIRRMVEAVNHEVHELIRIRMGPITLGALKAGEWRRLSAAELRALDEGRDEPLFESGDRYFDPAVQSAGSSKAKPRYKPGWARPKRRAKRGKRQ
ncbi:MAG: rRNA pseudouridine synthase [Anaerolineales bacterium]|nr:rRNA pseudouridine synthase [Anaerolineales bacterium]